MPGTRSLLITSALAFALLGVASEAMAAPIIVSKVTVIGNNATINRTGGTTTVGTSQSCSPGVTGSFFQSVMILFGGSSVNVVQATTCP